MRILITGGAGFIGSHLADRLAKTDHEVIVLDNFLRGNKLPREVLQAIELVEGDVRDERTVLDAIRGCDRIYHLAAVLGVDVVADNPVETMETEVIGMRNIVKGAIKHRVDKLIYASTSGVYGKAAIQQALDEEFHVSPSSSYSIAKRFNEIFLKSVYQEKRLESVSLRFFNVYGPRQDNRMVIPRFFEQALAGQPLTVYGTGKQTRDFTYISDAIESVVRVADCAGSGEIVNVCNSTEYTIHDLAEEILAVTGSESPIELIKPPTGRYDFEVERRCGSAERLQQLCGYAPATPLRKGLEQTFSYMQA